MSAYITFRAYIECDRFIVSQSEMQNQENWNNKMLLFYISNHYMTYISVKNNPFHVFTTMPENKINHCCLKREPHPKTEFNWNQ